LVSVVAAVVRAKQKAEEAVKKYEREKGRGQTHADRFVD